MKKFGKLALVAILMVVSMGMVFAGEKTIKVNSWDKFVTAFSTAKYSKDTCTIQLSKDITCPAVGKIQGFSADDATRIAIQVPDGVTIDLNGKTIKCPTNGIELIGTNFTIKNGTFDTTEAANNSGYYALVISADGYDGSSAYAQGISKQNSASAAKKVVIDNLNAPGIFLCGVSAEVKNCDLHDAKYRALVFWGSSGTIENSQLSSTSTNGALVCKYSNEVLIKSNVTLKGSKALQLDSECYVEVVKDAVNVVIEAVGISGLKVDCPAPIYMVAATDMFKAYAPITLKASLSNYIVTDLNKAGNYSFADGTTYLDENGSACSVGVIEAKQNWTF